MMNQWEITSAVADIFDPPENPVTEFIKRVDSIMNGCPFLLKGRTNKPIQFFTDDKSFLYDVLRNHFNDLFFDFDRHTNYDYHDWRETPESLIDFDIGYKPAAIKLVKSDFMLKVKPMSYLGFVERLYWTMRTSKNYHQHAYIDHDPAQQLIRKLSHVLFGEECWTTGDMLPILIDVPDWIPHPWTFYDIMPDFLHTTGYWRDKQELAYFDGGSSDSATFFFKDKTFYLFLTCGAP